MGIGLGETERVRQSNVTLSGGPFVHACARGVRTDVMVLGSNELSAVVSVSVVAANSLEYFPVWAELVDPGDRLSFTELNRRSGYNGKIEEIHVNSVGRSSALVHLDPDTSDCNCFNCIST